jgi:hypothetical protein
VLAQALERLMAVANQVNEADTPDDDTDPNVPGDLVTSLAWRRCARRVIEASWWKRRCNPRSRKV